MPLVNLIFWVVFLSFFCHQKGCRSAAKAAESAESALQQNLRQNSGRSAEVRAEGVGNRIPMQICIRHPVRRQRVALALYVFRNLLYVIRLTGCFNAICLTGCSV